MLRVAIALALLGLGLACGGGADCPDGGLRLVYDVEGGDVGQVRDVLQRRLDAVSPCSIARVDGEQVVVELVGEVDPQVKPILRGPGHLTIRAEGQDGGLVDPVVEDAQVVDDQVVVTLAEPSASAFAELTSANVGEQLVIALDGEVLVEATVQEALESGEFSIHPGVQEDPAAWTHRLAVLLRSGSLPASITLATETTFP